MTATMMDSYRMIHGHPVEVMHVERTLILDLRIVEEIPLDPGTRRSLLGSRPQLVDDAVDGDELDFVGITNQHLVQQRAAIELPTHSKFLRPRANIELVGPGAAMLA